GYDAGRNLSSVSDKESISHGHLERLTHGWPTGSMFAAGPGPGSPLAGASTPPDPPFAIGGEREGPPGFLPPVRRGGQGGFRRTSAMQALAALGTCHLDTAAQGTRRVSGI